MPEGNVANGDVEEVIRESCVLEAVNGDVRVGIELSGYPPCEAVQLHAVEFGLAHALRQDAEEHARAAGGLQNVAVPETHAPKRLK